MDRDWGVTSYCDYAWWGFDSDQRDQIEVAYCWAGDPNVWDPNYINPVSFLEDFYATEDVVRSRVSRPGDFAETTVGHFDIVS